LAFDRTGGCANGGEGVDRRREKFTKFDASAATACLVDWQV